MSVITASACFQGLNNDLVFRLGSSMKTAFRYVNVPAIPLCQAQQASRGGAAPTISGADVRCRPQLDGVVAYKVGGCPVLLISGFIL